MKNKKPARRLFTVASSQYVFCGLATLAALMMVVPISTALSAGLASVSLVLFGAATFLLLMLLVLFPRIPRIILGVSLSAALFGCIVPQLAFLHSASATGTTLYFNPVTYLTFAGDTTIRPSRLLTYKSNAQHKLMLAVYDAHQPSPRPTVLLLHGGGWRYGSYKQTGQWPERLTNAGYTVISVQYRLSSDDYHTWLDAPSDVEDAVIYSKAHADQLGIDPTNLTIMGQSAGGHLALLEAYRNSAIKSVISLYAPIDLTLDYTTSRDKSAELDFIGGPPSQYPDRYAALSPIDYVTPNAPKTLLIQGKSDDLVATQNTQLLAARLTANRVHHSVTLLPMTGHSFENQRGGFATQIATQRVLRFLSE